MEDQVGDFLKQLAAKLELVLLIVGNVCYIKISGGSSQHSAVALCNLYVAGSERIVTWMRFRSVLFK